MIASLGGSFLSSTVWVSLDSKGFKESGAIFIMVGKLLLPLAMLLDCFCGPSFKVPRVLGCGIIGIRVDYGIKESFLQSFLEELYGSYVVEWETSIPSKSFKVAYIHVKAFLLFQASDFPLHIFGFMDIGEGLSEVCLKEVLKLFVVVLIASINSSFEEV